MERSGPGGVFGAVRGCFVVFVFWCFLVFCFFVCVFFGVFWSFLFFFFVERIQDIQKDHGSSTLVTFEIDVVPWVRARYLPSCQ